MKIFSINAHKVIVDDGFNFDPSLFSVRRVRNMFYVYRTKDCKFLHRLVLGLHKYDSKVDHLNRNGLDNRKENLRLTTNAENKINSSFYAKSLGVYRCSKTNKWYARIKDGPVRRNLGSFSSKEEAILKYKEEQQKLIFRACGGM